MKYADVVKTGANDPVPAMPTTFPLKGFRIVPQLGGAATAADVQAAYASLTVQVTRASQARSQSNEPMGVTDSVAVDGPHWFRSPGFNLFLITGGQVGVTYRVFWAEDCKEIVDVATPALPGYSGGGSSSSSLLLQSVAVGPAGAVTQAQSSTGNIPSLPTDGVEIRDGMSGAYAILSAPVGQTINGTPTLVWWRYSQGLSRWVETAIQEAPPIGRRDVMGVEQQVLCRGIAGERLYVEARSCTATAAGALEVTMVTQ